MSQAAKDATPETFHPEYLRNVIAWQTVIDICEGSKTVKEKGELYLPRLQDQEEDEWAAYLKRAVFFGGSGRTKEALSGMMMRKKPIITLPGGDTPDNEKLLADVTLQGEQLLDWVNKVLESAVSTGRAGTLIDYNEEEKRPYLAFYQSIDVLNWATERTDGRERLCFLIVREVTEELTDFIVDEKKLLRRYWIGDDQAVHFDTWIETGGENGGFENKIPDTILMRRGQPLRSIPFVFHNAAHLGPEVGCITLADIVALNLSHYQLTADLKNALHICGQPTPWATGVTSEESDDLMLGSTKAWIISDPNAKVGFLEFAGQGLEPLSKDIANTENQMATLGARLLFDGKKDAEAFETVQLRVSGETAALVKIAAHQSATLTEALQWFFWWEGAEDKHKDIDATIVLHHDFSSAQMAPTMLTALTASLQSNSISQELYFYNLTKGELVPEGHDLEAERAAISQRPVLTPPVPDPNTTPPKPPEKKPPAAE
jgi:hypothetical protein